MFLVFDDWSFLGCVGLKGHWEQCVLSSWMKVKGCQLSKSIVTQFSQSSHSHPVLTLKMYTDKISKELSVPISWSLYEVQLAGKDLCDNSTRPGSSLNARSTMYALNWMMLCYSWTLKAITKVLTATVWRWLGSWWISWRSLWRQSMWNQPGSSTLLALACSTCPHRFPSHKY